MSEFSFVYITCKDLDQARTIGRSLVEERLAACANCLPLIHSIYHWQDEVCEDEEALLILKTQKKHCDALIERASTLHSYDCPCIVCLPIEKGHADFLQWIKDESSND